MCIFGIRGCVTCWRAGTTCMMKCSVDLNFDKRRYTPYNTLLKYCSSANHYRHEYEDETMESYSFSHESTNKRRSTHMLHYQ
jgi:hypothetical protein